MRSAQTHDALSLSPNVLDAASGRKRRNHAAVVVRGLNLPNRRGPLSRSSLEVDSCQNVLKRALIA
jgi:hypothetical protein